MLKFEAYEDNGGSITLFIINDDGEAIAAYGNFEYEAGSLSGAIVALRQDDKAYLTFGGDYGGDIEMPTVICEHYDVERKMTVSELYNENAGDSCTTLIAWADSDGDPAYCNAENMGAAAHKALNIKEADMDADTMESMVNDWLADNAGDWMAGLKPVRKPYISEFGWWWQDAEDADHCYTLEAQNGNITLYS